MCNPLSTEWYHIYHPTHIHSQTCKFIIKTFIKEPTIHQNVYCVWRDVPTKVRQSEHTESERERERQDTESGVTPGVAKLIYLICCLTLHVRPICNTFCVTKRRAEPERNWNVRLSPTFDSQASIGTRTNHGLPRASANAPDDITSFGAADASVAVWLDPRGNLHGNSSTGVWWSEWKQRDWDNFGEQYCG